MDVADVAMRWVLDRPGVASVIVGLSLSGAEPRIPRLDDVAFEAGDLERFETWAEDGPSPRGDVFELEREPAGPHAAIMKYNLNRGDETLGASSGPAEGG